MHKRQLKRLEAKHAKDGELLTECNRIKSKIKFLKETIKAIRKNPNNVFLTIVAGINEEFYPISDCFDFPNEDLIDVINHKICELQQEFKRI